MFYSGCMFYLGCMFIGASIYLQFLDSVFRAMLRNHSFLIDFLFYFLSIQSDTNKKGVSLSSTLLSLLWGAVVSCAYHDCVCTTTKVVAYRRFMT
jgi:hypothetical protein